MTTLQQALINAKLTKDKTTKASTKTESNTPAYIRYMSGKKPTFSTGICGSITAGYGTLDQNGYFEYPLVVCQTTHEIVEDVNVKTVKSKNPITL